MTADPRVEQAREYLGYAREVKVGDLPLGALMRMAAELRRQLGEVLDVVRWLLFIVEDAAESERLRAATHVDVDGGVWLTPPHALILGQVLADAISLRSEDDDRYCADCEAIAAAPVPGDPGGLAPGLCDQHAADLEQASAYRQLAAALGIEVDR